MRKLVCALLFLVPSLAWAVEATFTAAAQTTSEVKVTSGYTVQIQGTFTGSIVLERKIAASSVVTYGTVRTFTSTFEGNDAESGESFTYRLRAGSDFSGTAQVRLQPSGTLGASNIFSDNTTVSGTVTANQGTAAAASGAWPVKVTDGTDIADVINTAPTGTEQGLVVRLPGGAADDSTNSTYKLPALTARANAAAPTWTEGRQVPISVDLNGNVRSVVSEAMVVGPAADGAAVSGNPVRIAGKDGSGNTQDIATDTSGEVQVDVISFPDNEPINVGQWGGTSTTLGQKAMSASVPVAIASDQSAVPASQSGAWTVQPGNTANTTPWLTRPHDGTDGALIEADGDLNVSANQNGTWNINNVSGTVSLPTGAATSANQSTQITAEQAVQTAVEIMDDWDETNRAAVNTIAGQVGVQGGSGVATGLTQRVVLATDVALPAGDNNIGNVDLASAIPAGSNLIGSVNVNVSGVSATVDAESAGITSDTTLEAATASLRLVGWTVRENAGTPAVATVVLRHDTVAATCDGPPFAYIELDANQSAQMYYGDRGLAAASGVCADVLAGTVDVNIFTVTEGAP